MKHIRLFAALFCCVVTLVLPVTPAFPAGAELQPHGDFLYEVIANQKTGYSYVRIAGYTGNQKEVTLPATIDGVPVKSAFCLWNGDGECPERLVIPEGVVVIGELFFRGKSDALTEVVLPSTLKAIGQSERGMVGAFYYTTSLKELTIPPSVGLITKYSFHEDLLLRVEAGSYAHRWAKANEHPFEIIQHDPSIGDYDADGLTTSTDARLLLQEVTGKVPFDEAQAAVADVDRDGEVTTTDARLTLQYAAGKEAVDTLACPLTFNVPFLPREAAADLKKSYTGYSEDKSLDVNWLALNYYSVSIPIENPAQTLADLNQRIGRTYNAIAAPIIKGYVTGTSLFTYVNGVPFSLDYRLSYYGLSLDV